MLRRADTAGFSLVELVVAMFLLGIIAVALLPVLWNGIRYSSEQSTVATATRQLNSLVDQARDGGTCDAVAAATGVNDYMDGAGRGFSIRAENAAGALTVPACASGSLVSFTLVARQGGDRLAQVDAIVYIP
ncbi:hypothetical protein GCM10022200_01660 [Microbacterium awajiense]|uniref:Prepilin-type N-terminal cleavage/methylation domain-containing protein n=1 Tax=Microbacterium awajiense TaxID=415214 RepID=A0ABP6ZZ93_9MICO